jgi:hypothetical protein
VYSGNSSTRRARRIRSINLSSAENNLGSGNSRAAESRRSKRQSTRNQEPLKNEHRVPVRRPNRTGLAPLNAGGHGQDRSLRRPEDRIWQCSLVSRSKIVSVLQLLAPKRKTVQENSTGAQRRKSRAGAGAEKHDPAVT